MTSHIIKFDVVVLTKDNPDKVKPYYSGFGIGDYRNWEERKMKHIDARTHEQAKKKAEKYGRVLSVRKHISTRSYGKIENIKLDQEPLPLIVPQFSKAIAMDEMIWKKRNVRRNNMQRDKNKY